MLAVIHKCFPSGEPSSNGFVPPWIGERLEYHKIMRDLTCIGCPVMVTTLRQKSAPFFRLLDFARDSRLCVAYKAKEEISRTRAVPVLFIF